jgi:outer membrane lipoprotein SlyB
LALASLCALSGCAATQVAIAKRDLDVQTRMSATIFLDPVRADQRTVLVQVRNTSDRPDLDPTETVIESLRARGYSVVSDPSQARYFLQANVLYVGKSSPIASQTMLGGGYGSAVSGAALGIGVGSATGGMSGRSVAAGAVLGGIAETVAGAFVKDVHYSIVTDVQIKERVEGKATQVSATHELRQGTSGTERVSYSDSSDMRAYQTRIVSTANQVNLEFNEALPALRAGLVRAMAGLF